MMAERASKKPKVGEGGGAEPGGMDHDQEQEQEQEDTLEEPLDMLARVRRERADRLLAAAATGGTAPAASAAHQRRPEAEHEHEHDLPMKIRLVRALLTTNEEIWDRCCRRTAQQRGRRLPKDAKGRAYAVRLIYRHVSVEPTISRYEAENTCRERKTGGESNACNSVFKVKASYQKLTLGEDIRTVSLPEELASIFPVPIADDGFPNYGRYLELALLLSEDVLSPFLDHLRRHLEAVQVALGKVEAWQQEVEEVVSFLTTAFAIDQIADPAKKNCSNDYGGCRRIHDDKEVCLVCGQEYSEHNMTRYSREDRHACPFPNSTRSSTAEFLVSLPMELKTIKDTGEHRDSYDICTKAGREKLTKFLDYLS